MKMYIYKITNLLNGKVYIGQTKDLKRRWYQHRSKKTNQAISLAIHKYGIDNFKFECIVCCIGLDNVNELERYFISLYKSNVKGIGYNLTTGGQDRITHSEETISKIVFKLKGKPCPTERRQRISNTLKGRPLPEEVKAKLKGRISSRKGIKASAETILKQKLAAKKVVFTEERRQKHKTNILKCVEKQKRKIFCHELNCVFFSVTDAAKFIGDATTNISKQIRGDRNHVKGYTFSYYEVNNG